MHDNLIVFSSHNFIYFNNPYLDWLFEDFKYFFSQFSEV